MAERETPEAVAERIIGRINESDYLVGNLIGSRDILFREFVGALRRERAAVAEEAAQVCFKAKAVAGGLARVTFGNLIRSHFAESLPNPPNPKGDG